MKYDSMLGLALTSFFLLGASHAQDLVTPDQVVGAMERQFGVTPGQRRNHINGVCVTGSFVGESQLGAFTRSPLFSGKPIPVVGRFSLAGGSLKTPDTARNPRGMALEFRLPDETLQHFTMLNVPVFGVATPQAFYEGIVANIPDKQTGRPDPEKLAAYKAAHPEGKALQDFLVANNPVASYARSDFFSIHAFKFVNTQGAVTLVKWRFEPRDGVERLTDDELKAAPARFLNETLAQRVAQGPIQWDMVLVIGKTGDEQINPTVYWPKDREEIHAGVLSLTQVTPQEDGACEKINFDPLVMGPGIQPTADPILNFRSGAYAASFAKRLTHQ